MPDDDFISDLDKTFSNVGTDVHWVRKVGNLELWISPLSILGQERVTKVIGEAQLGTNIVGESKRMTLCNAIVGVNGSDLREYRNGAAVFPVKNREGKLVKVRLEDFLHHKSQNWSAQYIDDLFAVYSDLMETFEKQNLKDVKFENVKDPRVELQELESRAGALRAQLGLPPMIEDNGEKQPSAEEVAKAIEEEEEGDRAEAQRKAPEPGEDFDPFKTVPREERTQRAAAAVAPRHIPVEDDEDMPDPFPPRQRSVPAAVPADVPMGVSKKFKVNMPPGYTPESSPDNPHRPTPSVANEVLDRPAERKVVAPPVINPKNLSVNPRFAAPRRAR